MNNFDSNALKLWFEAEKRPMPWRENHTPYAVWISEIMLQQTQVAVVIPYFLNWMKVFPSIQALAEASLDVVIKHWEGLGYYARARALHEGARYIVEHFHGELPSNEVDLMKIKGIGPYTVGAIRSFAFHQKAPAVDGNVMRVLARYFNINEDISKSATIKRIWNVVAELLPENEPWVFNEALIELGATICSRKPKCNICPIKKSCQGYILGTPEALPYNSKKTTILSLDRAVAVIQTGNQYLVRRGDKGKIMSDLYEFPYFEITEKGIETAQFEELVQQSFEIKVSVKDALPNISHSFTRFKVRLFPSIFKLTSQQRVVSGYEWLDRTKLDQLAFSSGHRRIYQSLFS